MSRFEHLDKSHALLGALLLIWAVASVQAVMSLESEGAMVCEKLTASLERYPGEGTPCRVTSFDAEGQPTSEKRFHFEEGELASVDVDSGADGTVDMTFDCTLTGRVLMPLTHTGNWLSAAVSNDLRSRSKTHEFIERRVVETDDGRVTYLSTDPDIPGLTSRREDHHNGADQLVKRRFFREGTEPAVRTLEMEYDDRGRLTRLHRQTEFAPSARITRLGYEECEAVSN